MFVAIYKYTMPDDKTKKYVDLEKQAIQIYQEHGCLGVEIYRDAQDPRKWMEINRYKDRAHFNEVMEAVDRDPKIRSLLQEFIQLFEDGQPPIKEMYYRMI